MTSDYVDAVLFQLRWEAFEDLDGYFMGLYDKPESSDEADDEAEYQTGPTVRDFACQTPREWLSLRPAQEAKEAAPGRAPPRNRPLEPGMTTPERVLNTKRIHEYSLEY